jgi:predicted GNAT family acetyltransferase
LINCFWVSGQYKGKGYGKALLQMALDDAMGQGKNGLVTVVGKDKFHFMSDTKWLKRQGFDQCDQLQSGFVLLARKVNENTIHPTFKDTAVKGLLDREIGLTAYYSNRCPFTEYHVTNSLVESAKNRGLSLKIIKISTMEQAQSAPTPATIFSLYYNGKFVTTDLSVCMDSRFDKVMGSFILP